MEWFSLFMSSHDVSILDSATHLPLLGLPQHLFQQRKLLLLWPIVLLPESEHADLLLHPASQPLVDEPLLQPFSAM